MSDKQHYLILYSDVTSTGTRLPSNEVTAQHPADWLIRALKTSPALHLLGAMPITKAQHDKLKRLL